MLCLASNILMQFQDPLLVLTEVCRVVKPGGVVGFRELTFDGNLYEPPAGAATSTMAVDADDAAQRG